MVSKLGELIARYEAAQARVMKLVAEGPGSDADLQNADRELSAAFNDILQRELDTPREYLERVRFLLDQIKAHQGGNRLVERLADQVLQDVLDSENDLSPNLVNQSGQTLRSS